MLDDFTRATRYEIDKAREISLWERKDCSSPDRRPTWTLLHGRAGGRLCLADSACFPRQIKIGGGGPDRTADPRLMSPLLCQLSYTATPKKLTSYNVGVKEDCCTCPCVCPSAFERLSDRTSWVGVHIRRFSSFHHSGFILEVYSVGCQKKGGELSCFPSSKCTSWSR